MTVSVSLQEGQLAVGESVTVYVSTRDGTATCNAPILTSCTWHGAHIYMHIPANFAIVQVDLLNLYFPQLQLTTLDYLINQSLLMQVLTHTPLKSQSLMMMTLKNISR